MRISDWSSDVCSSDLGASCTISGSRSATRPASSSTGCRARTWPTPDATRGSAAPMDKDAPILNALVVEAARVIVGDPKVAAQPWDKYAMVAWYGEGVSRSEEHTSELQSLMRITYPVCCLHKKKSTIAIP